MDETYGIPENKPNHEFPDDHNGHDDLENYEYDGEEEPEAPAEPDGKVDASAGDAGVFDALAAAVENLTVTSRQLADITKARGYYQPKGRGDSKGKKGKGKGRGKQPGFSKGKFDGKGKPAKGGGKGFGKPSPMPTKGNLEQQQRRLRDSLCLGCGSPSHWLKECPSFSTHSAQLTTSGMVLDSDGMATSWTASASASKTDGFAAPELVSGLQDDPEHKPFREMLY